MTKFVSSQIIHFTKEPKNGRDKRMSTANKTELIATVGGTIESTVTSPTRNTPSVKNEINIQLGHNMEKTEDNSTIQDDTVFQTTSESQHQSSTEEKERPPSGIIEEKYLEEAKQVLESESESPDLLVEEEEKTKSNSSSVDESTYEQVENIEIETPIESTPEIMEESSPIEESPEVSKAEVVKETSVVNATPFYVTYKKELAVLGTIFVAGVAVLLRKKTDAPES
ncbi:uncharacterized protein [Clytia hemisphaerica]|uniref:Uncharacterized protein n=1 Tax=Clytia hemisphaerica TaxID=252671 RepID=A0A7M5TSY6_9CNID